MKFEQVYLATESGGSNPATLIARHILKHPNLAFVEIESQQRGRSYQNSGRGFTVEPDDELNEAERKEAARELANAIVEICAEAQEGSNKTINWKVTGYEEPDNGDRKTLFQEKFKVPERVREPTRKETTEDVITGSNHTLRHTAEDAHKNYMDIARLLLRTIEPISKMSSNLAEKIRPSDAEVAARVRGLEIELEADVAKAEAINKRASSEARVNLIKGLFDELPMEHLGEAAKLLAKAGLLNAQRRADESAAKANETPSPPGASDSTPPTPSPQPSQAPQDPVTSPDTSDLCNSSRTFAEIIEGRREALAAELGDRWASIEPLAAQTDEAEFIRLAKALYEELNSLGKMQQLEIFTAMNKGLDDDDRTERLHAFLKGSGVLKG